MYHRVVRGRRHETREKWPVGCCRLFRATDVLRCIEEMAQQTGRVFVFIFFRGMLQPRYVAKSTWEVKCT